MSGPEHRAPEHLTSQPLTSHQGAATRAISGGWLADAPGEPIAPPLVLSATFVGGGPNDELLYTRYGNNPTQRAVAQKLAALQNTEAALVLGSGMAAIAMTALALVPEGGRIVAARHLYGATFDLFTRELPRRGIKCTLVDPDVPETWESAIGPDVQMVYLELPTNPTLRLTDPRPVARLARAHGIPVVVDATFASPIHLDADALGIDVVIHSATKYLGGHSDLIGGVVAGPADLVDRITSMMRLYGPSADPHMAWLLDRGIRTLPLRMERHDANARRIAQFLSTHPGVAQAIHPSLPTHPDHALAAEIMPSGSGGMVSFVLSGGGAAADRFMMALRLVQRAPSLGGVESLVSEPRYTSHKPMTPEQRAEIGIPDGFIRLSVGLEDVDDLIADLEQALAAARSSDT